MSTTQSLKLADLSPLIYLARDMAAAITAAVDQAVPPGTPFRRQRSDELYQQLAEARGLTAVYRRIEALEAESARQTAAWRAEYQRQRRREALARSPRHMLAGIERRLRAAGLRVDRSPRSETRYVAAGNSTGGCILRLSTHRLGWADYGTREQVHHGPEVVVEVGESPADILAACLSEVREYAVGLPREDILDQSRRRDAAGLLRGLRLALRRAMAQRH